MKIKAEKIEFIKAVDVSYYLYMIFKKFRVESGFIIDVLSPMIGFSIGRDEKVGGQIFHVVVSLLFFRLAVFVDKGK